MAEFDELLQCALAVQKRAYAPYSQFPVGAALVDEAGAIHTGVNVENAAYPNGTCAETAAIAAMIASGGTMIRAIAVVGPGEALCTPCGSCRQRIREFADGNTKVVVGGSEGVRKVFSLSELLPHSFGPENLAG